MLTPVKIKPIFSIAEQNENYFIAYLKVQSAWDKDRSQVDGRLAIFNTRLFRLPQTSTSHQQMGEEGEGCYLWARSLLLLTFPWRQLSLMESESHEPNCKGAWEVISRCFPILTKRMDNYVYSKGKKDLPNYFLHITGDCPLI